MRRGIWPLAAVLLASVLGAGKLDQAPVARRPQGRPNRPYGQLPLRFEVNEGQVDHPDVRFVARSRGATLFVTDTAATVAAERGAIRFRIEGARSVEPRGGDPLLTRSSYFIGNDPSRWRVGVPSFGSVRYPSVLDGVDLVFHGEDGQLEYDFVVEPGWDPAAITVMVEGASRLAVRDDGALAIDTPAGRLVQPKPRVYQRDEHGIERDVGASYRIVDETKVAFALERWDSSRELVIDPVLEYSALVGAGGEAASGIATDATRNVYITGRTSSLAFPTVLPLQPTKKGPADAFVAKMNPQGSALVWATYLGGDQADNGASLDVDSAGNVYVAGDTTSSDFPTVTPVQATRAGQSDAFVTKISASGSSLLYSTYLGGTSTDEARTVRVDSSGRAHVVGETVSTNFPTLAPIQANHAGGTADVFVTTLAASGASLAFSTYLGSSSEDRAPSGAMAVDSAGATYLTGWTSGAFPTTSGTFQTARKGTTDAYALKIAPAGSLAWSTYLGGTDADRGYGVTVDAAGRVYVAGVTYSADFPVKGTMQPYKQLADGFVTKLEGDGTTLVYSTLFGGPEEDNVFGSIAVDANGCVALGGSTESATGFLLVNPVQSTHAGLRDGFVAKVNASGSAFVFSSYLGSSEDDNVKGVAIDTAGHTYVVGDSGSHEFPSTPPLNQGSGPAVFVTKLATTPLVGSPSLVTVRPKHAHTLTASGGNPPYTYTMTTNPSGGSVTASGVYTAGAVEHVLDVVSVHDRGGLEATVKAYVGTPLEIHPNAPSVAPLGKIGFSVTGGTGTGFVWSLSQSPSNATIVPATGVYTAGSVAKVFDRVEVRDSLGNVGSTDVNVGGVLTIARDSTPTPPRGHVTLSATGGTGAYVWSMAAAPSGGTVDPTTGEYLAGSVGDVTDRVTLKDSAGASTTVEIAVGPGVLIAPPSLSIRPGGRIVLAASGGSGKGYVWSLTKNESGATLTENQLAVGPKVGVDVVSVKDDLDNSASVEITVTEGIAYGGDGGVRLPVEPAMFGGGGGCASVPDTWSVSNVAPLLGLASMLAIRARRRRR